MKYVKKNYSAHIKILIGTGLHRKTTQEEMVQRFGYEIAQNEEIIVHDAYDDGELRFFKNLKSGTPLYLNGLVDWADLIVAEGFIEPHFFAGFSGGRKCILPGIAGAVSVKYNHCALMIEEEMARTGILQSNPISDDMKEAAELTRLKFILNVVIDGHKDIVSAFAGDPYRAHEAGCLFVKEMSTVKKCPADIVITTNGGYPLDQNVYQSVKSMTAAEQCVNEGGVIIDVSECSDGSGGEEFLRYFSFKGPGEVMEKIRATASEDTLADQWQAQILARVMLKCTVIMVSDIKARGDIEGMGILYCSSIDDAVKKALELKPQNDGIVFIPDGVSVIVE